MKLTFKLNALVAALITSAIKGFQVDKCEQACEAYRNGMEVLETKQDRSLRIAGSKDSRRADERETLKITRRGEDNVVARFIAYNDEVTKLVERTAKVEAQVTLVTLPSEFGVWASKFDKDAKQPKAPKTPKNGNGAPELEPANRLQPATA